MPWVPKRSIRIVVVLRGKKWCGFCELLEERWYDAKQEPMMFLLVREKAEENEENVPKTWICVEDEEGKREVVASWEGIKTHEKPANWELEEALIKATQLKLDKEKRANV